MKIQNKEHVLEKNNNLLFHFTVSGSGRVSPKLYCRGNMFQVHLQIVYHVPQMANWSLMRSVRTAPQKKNRIIPTKPWLWNRTTNFLFHAITANYPPKSGILTSKKIPNPTVFPVPPTKMWKKSCWRLRDRIKKNANLTRRNHGGKPHFQHN